MSPRESSGSDLLGSCPIDFFHFGFGNKFNPRAVSEALSLKTEDVSYIASVHDKSVCYDKKSVGRINKDLEEIGTTMNIVATFFKGDIEKTLDWFNSKNPMLGDVSPREMICLGRFYRLRKFIVNSGI